MSEQYSTKRFLQEKAFNLIEKKGYDNVTVDEICKELGLTKGAFYHYFKSKSDILIKDYRNFEGELLSYYNELIQQPAQIQLNKILDWYIDCLSNDFQKFTTFAKSQLEKSHKGNTTKYTTQIVIFKNIIEKGINQGHFNPKINSTDVANFIYTYISGLIYLKNTQYGIIDFRSELKKFYEIFLKPILLIEN